MIARAITAAGAALALSQVFSLHARPTVFITGVVLVLIGGCWLVDELERQS